MARRPYSQLAQTPVPQTEALDARQVQNNAGGFVYQITDQERLERFLVLGSDAPTYYQTAPKLTRENAACVERCYATDAARTVNTIVAFSQDGRAPKNDAAIFALALGTVSPAVAVRRLAYAAIPEVCRIATHLFQFIDNRKALVGGVGGGWNRSMRRAVAAWYDNRSVGSVAYQAIKYRQRNDYTHKRAFHCSRPHNYDGADRIALYKWIKDKEYNPLDLPPLVTAHLQAMKPETDKATLLKLIEQNRLPWEAIPTDVTKDPKVWATMLPNLGMTALIRNLGSMTAYGTLAPLNDETKFVTDKLTNEAELQKARIHPYNVLLALTAYRAGTSIAARRYGKDGLKWTAVPRITEALEEAFYKSFKFIQPSGKRTLIALDVSGSMSSPMGGSHLTVAEGAAAMAMTTLRTEQQWHVFGFANTFRELGITPSMSLAQVLQITDNQNFGGTDCSLPMTYALQHKLLVDVFVVYTDNETWSGRSHPMTALRNYRSNMGINAKLAVVGMTSTGFSIADPNDTGSMDFAGWDAAAPAILADFARR